MKQQLKRLGYEAAYTACSYADALMTLPIVVGEGAARGIEKILGDTTPRVLTRDYTRAHSSVHAIRQLLREKMDTRPGTLYLGSGFISSIPFFGAGIPMAEIAQRGIERFMPDAPLLVQSATNSAATLAAQIVTGYSTFMASEVFLNRQKYVDDTGHLSRSKLGTCLKNTIKTWLFFDLAYIGAKLAGQSYMLMKGEDPWAATSLFDSAAIPITQTVAIMLGIRGGLIETRHTRELKAAKENIVTPS